MNGQNTDILEHIHATYYQLRAAERKIADYVLTNFEQVQFMSITQLADECGTADATVTRFCQSLELKGFNAFKIELAKYAAAASSKSDFLPHQEGDYASAHGRCREVGRLTQEAVSQTVDLVNHQAVEKTVDFFEKAGTVMCVGSGGSSIIASECSHLFSNVSNKFLSIADSHLQLSMIATMKPGDTVVLFSYSGATTAGLQLLEIAKSRNLHTVLVTRYPKSPIAKLAEVVLLCGSNESPIQQGSVRAKVAQLVVIDVLYQEYYFRNRKACDENMQNIVTVLSGMHL